MFRTPSLSTKRGKRPWSGCSTTSVFDSKSQSMSCHRVGSSIGARGLAHGGEELRRPLVRAVGSRRRAPRRVGGLLVPVVERLERRRRRQAIEIPGQSRHRRGLDGPLDLREPVLAPEPPRPVKCHDRQHRCFELVPRRERVEALPQPRCNLLERRGVFRRGSRARLFEREASTPAPSRDAVAEPVHAVSAGENRLHRSIGAATSGARRTARTRATGACARACRRTARGRCRPRRGWLSSPARSRPRARSASGGSRRRTP